jgi:hypothetical protein
VKQEARGRTATTWYVPDEERATGLHRMGMVMAAKAAKAP